MKVWTKKAVPCHVFIRKQDYSVPGQITAGHARINDSPPCDLCVSGDNEAVGFRLVTIIDSLTYMHAFPLP